MGDALDRYTDINQGFSRSLKYTLTGRGFYSEVCGLLNAAVFCQAKKTRLLVSEAAFSGFRWDDFFKGSLPLWNPDQHGDIADLSPGLARRYNKMLHRFAIPVYNRHDRRLASVFAMQSCFAKMFCQPVAMVDSLPRPYIAVQLRRGDKTNGYMLNGALKVESAETPIAAYVSLLRQRSNGIRRVFVLADDYRSFEELKTQAPEFDYHTHCQPTELGYVNDDFQKMALDEKRQLTLRLVGDVHICGQAEVFIGPFQSNPSRFVPLLQGTRRKSFSVDAQHRWKP